MGIVMSLAMCVGISPFTTIIYLCFNRNKSISAICTFLCTSVVFTITQFNFSDAFKYFDMIPPWVIIATGVSYSLLFSSIFRYILV